MNNNHFINEQELKHDIDYANLSLEDMRKLYDMKEKDDILSKYKFPQKRSSDGYYHIQVDDFTKKNGRRQFKDKEINGLKEKVYQFEKSGAGTATKSFQGTFEIVQTEKVRYIKNPEKLVSVNNTISRNRSEYKRYFGGTRIEKMLVNQITKKDIETVILLNLERYSLHAKALASMKSILKSIFDYAYCENWITDNPYQRINFYKFSDMLTESTPIEERAYSDNDIDRIMNHIHDWQKKKPCYIPAYALEMQIICAMRRGEMPPLMWTDLSDDHILIHRQLLTVKKQNGIPEHFVIVSHTKTYKNRKYPVTEELEEFFTRLKAVHDKYYPDSEFLFPADNENGCITNNTVYNYFRRVCTKLNISIDKEVIKGTHAFRRTKITQFVNKSGGNLVLASELFGNSPEVARKNYYIGIDLAQAKQVLSQ